MVIRAKNFRPEIEGLRAVAILLVLFFHAGLPVAGGYVGVDVFFVISGFLITSLLLREAEVTHTVSLLGFYARRAKRLLPASFLVLCCTALVVAHFIDGLEELSLGWDVAAAAGYVANWRFAAVATDYLAEDEGRSALLHFWSLAVEEQFYMLWPLLVLGAARLARRRAWSLEKCAAWLLALVVLPSFAYSWWFTAADSSQAFFSTATRLWELGCGAYLALGSRWVARWPQRLAILLGTLGWSLLGAAVVLCGRQTAWPGSAALLPVLGTTSLIASAVVAPRNLTLRPLLLRPMVALGGLSYSLYLWHWPILVVATDFLGLKGPLYGSLLVASSLLPAWLSYRYVERPFRVSVDLNQVPKYALSLGANLSLVGVLLGVATVARVGTDHPAAEQIRLTVRGGRMRLEPKDLGAAALGSNPRSSSAGDPTTPSALLIPRPQFALADLPIAYARDCQMPHAATDIRWCEIGDPQGKLETVLVGDSKILQYFEALDAVGKTLGLRIRTATKSSCPFSAAGVGHKGKAYSQCDRLNIELMEKFKKDPPDLVITSQDRNSGTLPGEDQLASFDDMVRGLVSHWSQLEDFGTNVVVLLDNPHPPTPIYKCVKEHPSDYGGCIFSRDEGIKRSAAEAQLAAAKLVPSVDVIDLTDYICPQPSCAPAIGGVLIYRQGTHITNSYAKTLAPILYDRLTRILHKD